MPGSVAWSPQGHHKRPHEEFVDPPGGGQHILPAPTVYDYQQQPFTAATVGASDLEEYVSFSQQQQQQQQQLENSSQESSHKRARLYGEYRHNSSVMDESSADEDGETALCSNVAVRSTSEDASSTARWLLRSSPSNYSITSTLTEVSDTMDATFEATDADGQPLRAPESSGRYACIVLEGTPGIGVGDQVENITNCMERSWSLSRMKTRRISNTLSEEAARSEQIRETMSDTARRYRQDQTKQAKREVMRAFRKSNSITMDYGL